MTGRLTNAERQAKARKTLVETLTKIHDIDSPLGRKWRDGMVAYYVGVLAELLLRQAGLDDISELVQAEMERQIYSVLEY